jgi:hypothetical protein
VFLDAFEDDAIGSFHGSVALRENIEEKHMFVPSCEQNFLKVAQSNCFPLSTITFLGTPKRHTMFCQKNFCRAPAVISRSTLASIHLEKYSTATAAHL